MRHVMLIVLALIASGCTSTPQASSSAADSARASATFDRVKSLAGTWETIQDNGEVTTCVYEVTSNGSVVREIMFPGSKHEMTNMYTMDGADVVVTHYCAIGNQPRMRATGGDPDRIAFKCVGVGNLAAPDQMYMGELTLVFVDADHIRQEWRTFKDGKLADHDATFTLTRRN